MNTKMTKEQFVDKAREMFGDYPIDNHTISIEPCLCDQAGCVGWRLYANVMLTQVVAPRAGDVLDGAPV